MWQRFTESARKVIFYAQEEAQRFGEGYVSTEHLILGLLKEEDTTASDVLRYLKVDPERIREEVEKHLANGDMAPSHEMTLTPRAKRVIDLAYDEARKLSNNFIGSEHLLLGLCREGDGLAGKVLRRMGIVLEELRKAVVEVQAIDPYSDSAPLAVPKPPPLPNIWSKCTPDAQSVIVEAMKLAMGANGIIHSEYLFLSLLLQQDNKAKKIINQFGVSFEKLVEDITVSIPEEPAVAGIQILLTTDARKVMETAYHEAKRLNSEQIGTEHILLALTQSDRIAGRVLSNIASNIVAKMNEEADSN